MQDSKNKSILLSLPADGYIYRWIIVSLWPRHRHLNAGACVLTSKEAFQLCESISKHGPTCSCEDGQLHHITLQCKTTDNAEPYGFGSQNTSHRGRRPGRHLRVSSRLSLHQRPAHSTWRSRLRHHIQKRMICRDRTPDGGFR